MEQLTEVLWQLFVIFIEIFGPLAIIALAMFARKYLKGKTRLLYIITEKHMEEQLNVFLNEAIEYANEQAHKSKTNAVGGKQPDKMAIALKMATSLLSNSNLPNIAENRLMQLLEKELGATRGGVL